jgi:hypothetical protein
MLPVEPSVEPPPVRPATLENDRLQSELPSLRKRASRASARFLITFCVGVGATLAWQSHRDARDDRELVPTAWLAGAASRTARSERSRDDGLAAPAAPSFDPQEVKGMSLDLDAVRQSIDRIATSIAAIQERMSRDTDRIATEQIARSVAQLTSGQEQMTREITKLQAVEQYVLYKSSEPPPRPAPTQPRSAAVAGTLTVRSSRRPPTLPLLQ